MIDYLKKFRLDGKTAYIMGGLGLIGKEVSTSYCQAGAKTIVLDVNDSACQAFEFELKDKGYEVTCRYFDCSAVAQLDKNFSHLLDEFGCPDVFINCSYPRTKDWGNSSFKDITLKSFRKNVDIHMNSYVWFARLVAEAMTKEGNGGSIIQLGSVYGIVGQDLNIYDDTDMHESMTYAAIKGGITNLTRLMASYYGQFNIRVNTLCPSGVAADMLNPIFVKQFSHKAPLKRLGRAEEIASTALFLASDAASYITGATIMVDGGWTAV